MTPFYVKNKFTCVDVPVPCGKCPSCVARRVSGWSFRLMQEDKDSDSSHFITLTYDTNNVPISRAGFMDLRKRDLQLFFKRLRKAHESKGLSSGNENPRKSIKYYAVGEYGSRGRRPHYHLILFNAKIELVNPSWDKGYVDIGLVSEASVGYTLKYMCKPFKCMHRNDDRQPHFSLMSKGLGLYYMSPQVLQWHYADLDNRMYCNIPGGKKIAMPRYYKERIYSETERKRIAYFARAGQLERQKKEMAEIGSEVWLQLQEDNKHAAFKQQAYKAKNRGIL